MPFERPSLAEIQERVRTDIRSRLPNAQPELRRSLLGVLADTEAGGIHGLYGYLDYLSKQIFPDTADNDYLLRWASIWGVDRSPAVAASGNVSVSGVSGSQVVSGSVLSGQQGIEYITLTTLIMDGSGTGLVGVEARTAGAAGNLDEGAVLSFVSPVQGVDGQVDVAAGGLTGGTDQQSIEQLRTELLNRIRQPPHGGAEADYVGWALAGHPDITRAWVYPNELDPGTVTVRVVTDDLPSLIPSQSILDSVQSYIDSPRPVQVPTYVVAPTAIPLDLSISLMPDSSEVRARVEAAVKDWLSRNAAPGSTIYLSELSGVIYVAAGTSRHTLQSPIADVAHAFNEIPVLGVITWL